MRYATRPFEYVCCVIIIILLVFCNEGNIYRLLTMVVVNSSVASRSRTVARKSNLGTLSLSYNFSVLIGIAAATTVDTFAVVVFCLIASSSSSDEALSVEPLIIGELVLLLLLLLL